MISFAIVVRVSVLLALIVASLVSVGALKVADKMHEPFLLFRGAGVIYIALVNSSIMIWYVGSDCWRLNEKQGFIVAYCVIGLVYYFIYHVKGLLIID